MCSLKAYVLCAQAAMGLCWRLEYLLKPWGASEPGEATLRMMNGTASPVPVTEVCWGLVMPAARSYKSAWGSRRLLGPVSRCLSLHVSQK